MREFLKKNWKQYTIWLLTCLGSGILGAAGFHGCIVPPPPAPLAPAPQANPGETRFGWVKDDEAVQVVVQALPFKSFADTPAGRAEDPLPKEVYLWDAYRKLYGKTPPAKNQSSIGSCVSFGTNNAVARSLAVEIAFKGAAFEYKDIAEEVTYGGSRVQVGGGRMGRSDGSVGAWAAEFVQKWGIVSREAHGTYDLSVYSVSRCRDFGYKGVPSDLQTVARVNPVKEITQVKSWEQAKKALASGYAIAVCSGQGFSMQRDSNGVARAQGSWSHCMCLDGYHSDGGREYGHIENSWGPDAFSGPVGWGEPSTAGFWAISATVDRMLRQNDSWAFSAVEGFPSRKIDWLVRKTSPNQHQRLYGILKLERNFHALAN